MYLDNPGGTQVHRSVYEAVTGFYERANANLDGPFETSILAGDVLSDARAAGAWFLGAGSSDEIIFGANMTTLTMHASRILLRDLGPGDEVLVTGLDHDANVAPWMLAAADRGVTVRQAGKTLPPSSPTAPAWRRSVGHPTAPAPSTMSSG